MKIAVLAALVAVSTAALVAIPAPTYPCDWTTKSYVHPATEVNFTITLKEQNMDLIKKIALDVSDPDSPNYGQFLSQQEIADITAPKEHHVEAVVHWLKSHNVEFTRVLHQLEVRMNVVAAERLLQTVFYTVSHKASQQTRVHADKYYLPAEVNEAVATIFGLDGLPLPPQAAKKNVADPVAVTPAVIAQAYSVPKVDVNRGGKNIQAVAEFQDQFMNKADLTKFFTNEVPDAKSGDDQVSKFVGSPYTEGSSVEAALDIQFIMGVADGVATQFWEFPNNDFCNDLNKYTTLLLTTTDVPFVNSISYGWQGDLSQLQCQAADLKVVDDNWAKLAANGISIMISSGDSGSGYTPPQCNAEQPGEAGVEITAGTLIGTENAEALQCCEIAQQEGAQGWTWYPPTTNAVMETRFARFGAFDNTEYTCEFSENQKIFKQNDAYELNGNVGPTGGTVKVNNLNGTFKATTMDFSAEYTGPGDEKLRNISMSAISSAGGKHYKFNGRAIYVNGIDYPLEIEFVDATTKEEVAVWRQGTPPPPPPPMGQCKLYKTVTAHGKANSTSIQSGGPAISPPSQLPTLYPSWPASSPWVTAVGATRFTAAAGSEEMASDQFGSGGGFSTRFTDVNATWQQELVAAYIAKGSSLPDFPPTSAFPNKGRATPDVSALGEGFQVYVDGTVEPVGGTSASSPMTGALISLINEERFAKGMPQMGFLNPFLYKNADCFTDIVKGTNAIGRGGEQLKYGFAAAEGWDAATGLGTPIYSKLATAALAAGERVRKN